MNILNGKYENSIVDWRNPELDKVVNSSGDITVCDKTKWSTELMDIDVNLLKSSGSTKFFTAVINYDFPRGDLAQVDTHIFFNIIDRKDRIISGRQIEIALDEMDYSYEINDAVGAQIGLLFDLETNEVEVLKIPLKNIAWSSTASSLRKEFLNLIKNRPEMNFIYDKLINCINASQIVDSPEDADTVLDENVDLNVMQGMLF